MAKEKLQNTITEVCSIGMILVLHDTLLFLFYIKSIVFFHLSLLFAPSTFVVSSVGVVYIQNKYAT